MSGYEENDLSGLDFAVNMIRSDDPAEIKAERDRLRSRVAELEGLLREVRHWFETQKKAISKGCGSSWDIGQCLEQINHIDAALAGQQQQGDSL